MHLARKLLLATTAALAVMAFMATAALGQSIEVTEEASGNHCGDVITLAEHAVDGGCEVHIVSESPFIFYLHNGLSELVWWSACNSEFTAHLNEDGTGYIPTDGSTIVYNPSAGCNLIACGEPDTGHPGLEWPISGLFEYGANQEGMLLNLCVSGIICPLIVDVIQTDHQQEFSASEEPCTGGFELSGHWVTEALPDGDEVDVELEHVHYPGD